MKQLLSLCLVIFGYHALFGQTQPLVQPEIKLRGKVCADGLIPGHEYVYLFTNYQYHVKDSALIRFDSTFEFTLRQNPLPLAYQISYKYGFTGALYPPKGEVWMQLNLTGNYNRGTETKELATELNYDVLKEIAETPLQLVKLKNFALQDSSDFNRELIYTRDSAFQLLETYQDSLHPMVYKEFGRWLNLNTQIAYLDFALLKRLHQKEKTFDRVSIDYTKEARRLLLDSNHLSFAQLAWNMLNQRVQALEGIDFKTSRFNPFEYQCEQIDMEVLRRASPQSDGLNCNYGLVGAVGFYLNQSQYQNGWLIIPRFENLSQFSNNYAIVVYNGRVGVIDACQNFVVQPNYSVLKEFRRSLVDSLPPIYIFRGARNYGLLDHTGRHLLEENYDNLFQLDASRLAYRPINGNKYGMIDTSGKIIMIPKYDVFYTGNMLPGFFKVANLHPFLKVKHLRDGNFFKPVELIGLIDSTGKEIVKPGLNDFMLRSNNLYTSNFYYNQEGLIWEAKKYHVLSRRIFIHKFGYISGNGVFRLKPTFDNIYIPDKNTSYLGAKKGLKTFIYHFHQPNKTPIKVDYLVKYTKGNSLFRLEGKYYLIDSAGSFEKYGSFDGFRSIYEVDGNKGFILLEKSGKWGLFSMQVMDWLLPPQWERINAFWKGFFVEKDGKMGFTDVRNIKLPTVYYDTVFQRSIGYYEARLGNQKIILDSNGNKIFETDADEVFHLNTGYFEDSNFVVKRGKQLFTSNGIQEVPLILDKVSLFFLYTTKSGNGALVSKKGYILGYSQDKGYTSKKFHGAGQQSPDLGNGNWLVYNNGLEMVIDEEANVKIPGNYRSIVPNISVYGNYEALTSLNAALEDSLLQRWYVVRSKTFLAGLYDAQFNMVLDTLYRNIAFRENLIFATTKKGMYIKDSSLRDIAFVKKGVGIIGLHGDRITIGFSNGKRGVYQLSKGLILKPKFKEVFMEPHGLILATKNVNALDQPLVKIYAANGKRLSRKSYTFIGQGLGIITLELDDFHYFFDANGKLVLKDYYYHSASVRVANFSKYLDVTNTNHYTREIDSTHAIKLAVFNNKFDDYDFKVVQDTSVSELAKDIINQLLYQYAKLEAVEVSSFDTTISKVQLKHGALDNWDFKNYLRYKTFYFDADSLYDIKADNLILDSMQVSFATNFVSEITKDKNVNWNACVEPERLFSHLRFEVDFNGQGLRFSTYSFEDIHGDASKKEVFYTWQELSPYLNKDHVLAKRFFGLNQK